MATGHPSYKKLNSEITGERCQQKNALLKKLREVWDIEHPLYEIEQQLSGFRYDQDVKMNVSCSWISLKDTYLTSLFDHF